MTWFTPGPALDFCSVYTCLPLGLARGGCLSGLSGHSPDVPEKSNCPVSPWVTFFAKRKATFPFPSAGGSLWLTSLIVHGTFEGIYLFCCMWHVVQKMPGFAEPA